MTVAQEETPVDNIVAEYLGGRSIRQIAARHHWSYATTRKLLADQGVQFRGRGGVRRKPVVEEGAA